jgi:hypothetical protein
MTMAAVAQRSITITYSGDVVGIEKLDAAGNGSSPAQIQVVTLATGDNVITVPGAGSTLAACTIMKPNANASAIKIKGNAADVGVLLHKTDPDTISLDPGVASFILNAAAQIVGVRLFWT